MDSTEVVVPVTEKNPSKPDVKTEIPGVEWVQRLVSVPGNRNDRRDAFELPHDLFASDVPRVQDQIYVLGPEHIEHVCGCKTVCVRNEAELCGVHRDFSFGSQKAMGLLDETVEEPHTLSDPRDERSCAGCTERSSRSAAL
jgi:hypothetical protein